jgi:hypothetical protein
MDISSVGIDVGIVAAIVVAVKGVTRYLDPKGKLARLYPLFPIVLAVPCAILRNMGKPWYEVTLQAFIYGCFAGQAYKTGKTTIFGQ